MSLVLEDRLVRIEFMKGCHYLIDGHMFVFLL